MIHARFACQAIVTRCTVAARIQTRYPAVYVRCSVLSPAPVGLPDPDSFILLLIRAEKQRQDPAGVDERYRQVFRPE